MLPKGSDRREIASCSHDNQSSSCKQKLANTKDESTKCAGHALHILHPRPRCIPSFCCRRIFHWVNRRMAHIHFLIFFFFSPKTPTKLPTSIHYPFFSIQLFPKSSTPPFFLFLRRRTTPIFAAIQQRNDGKQATKTHKKKKKIRKKFSSYLFFLGNQTDPNLTKAKPNQRIDRDRDPKGVVQGGEH